MEVRGVSEGCKVDARNRDYSLQRERGEKGCCLGVGHVVDRGVCKTKEA